MMARLGPLALAVALLAVVCSLVIPPPAVSEDTLAEIKKRGAINIFVEAQYRPYEFRDQSGLLLGSAVKEAADWDWPQGAGEHHVVLHVDRLPLADGRFHVGVALLDPSSSRLYHHVERAADFLVYPRAGTTGLVSFDARWEVPDPSSAGAV